MNKHHKKVMKSQKRITVKVIPQRYFMIYIRVLLKMQEILKETSPSRKLFETVNFAFMNFFDSLVKITILSVL